MPLSIADLRKSPHVGLPTETGPLCVAGEVSADFHAADQAFFLAAGEASVARDKARAAARDAEDGPRRVRRASDPSEVQALEARATELEAVAGDAAKTADALREKMLEHTVQVTLRAIQDGPWRLWCDAHPAREGDRRDRDEFAGICNSDALIASLGDWVTALNGEEPGPGDWEFVASNGAPGDLKALAGIVVRLQERGVNLGKSRLTWLNDQKTAPDSD